MAIATDHQLHQRQQREQPRGAVQGTGQPLVRLAVVRDRCIGQRRLQLIPRVRNGIVRRSFAGTRRRQMDQDTPRRARAGGQQAATLQGSLRDQHARTRRKRSGKPVRLILDNRGDAIQMIVQPDRVAGVQMEAQQQVVTHRHAVPRKGFCQRNRGGEHHLAVERVKGRVNGLQRYKKRVQRRGRRRHRKQLGDGRRLGMFRGREVGERA